MIAGAGHGESQFSLFRDEENIVLWAVSEAQPWTRIMVQVAYLTGDPRQHQKGMREGKKGRQTEGMLS